MFPSMLCCCQSHIAFTAVKAVTAAQLSMASQNVYSVTLDEAIEAMRLTAVDMSVKYKETSLSVCFHPAIHKIITHSLTHSLFTGPCSM